MDFVTFGAWNLLPLNPWYQKNQNFNIIILIFVDFIFSKNGPP